MFIFNYKNYKAFYLISYILLCIYKMIENIYIYKLKSLKNITKI